MAVLKERQNKRNMKKAAWKFWGMCQCILKDFCEMTSANLHIHKYMVLQSWKLFRYQVSSDFLPQDSQSSDSFGKIQNVRGISEENV